MVFKELAGILLLYTIACERINGVAATDGKKVCLRELGESTCSAESHETESLYWDIMEKLFPRIYGNIPAMVNMMQVNREFKNHFQPLVINIPRLMEFVPDLREQLFRNNGDLTTLSLAGKLL
jgi:hypothetical protein